MEEPDSPADPLRPHSPATKNHPPSTSAPNPKISAGGSGLSQRGVELFDLEYDVQAFNSRLPRVRIIPIEEFNPADFL